METREFIFLLIHGVISVYLQVKWEVQPAARAKSFVAHGLKELGSLLAPLLLKATSQQNPNSLQDDRNENIPVQSHFSPRTKKPQQEPRSHR